MAEVGVRLLGLAVVLGLVAMLAVSAGARPPQSDRAATVGVKKCRHFKLVRIKHGHRVHVRVKKCVRVRSKACRVIWSKRKRHGKVVIRKHNPVWVARVRCPKRRTGGGTGLGGGGTGSGSGVAGTFPLHVSSNGRFLETASNEPFLMVGDSPQSLIGNLSVPEAERFIDDRAAHGFNALWVNLLCGQYTFCNPDGRIHDNVPSGSGGTEPNGLAPFTSGTDPSSYDLSTPNPAFFSRAHTIIAYAQSKGVEVLLDPAETGSFGGTLVNNGSTTDYNYGVYLASTFKDLNNIIWLHGNDYTYPPSGSGSASQDADIQAVANGIKSVTPTALQTLEGFGHPGTPVTSLDNTLDNWTGVLKLNGSYTYDPAYGNVRYAYGQTSSVTIPAFLQETTYEGESVNYGGTPFNVRQQFWWTMTSGATGVLYGDYYTDAIGCNDSTNPSNCTGHGNGSGTISAGTFSTSQVDTTGVTQLGYLKSLLTSVAWNNLVPQANGTGDLITSGGGTCTASNAVGSDDCVSAAETSDKTLALAYDPQGNTITVDFSKMAAGQNTTARWFDPTNGTFHSISGSPFPSSGSHQFTTPGANSAGDPDWVLLLDP